MNRSGRDYIENLDGVKHLFSYIRKLSSNTILDIGAGTTRGIADISKSILGQQLHFEATVLTHKATEANMLGKEDVHVTSAEMLRGIPDNSVGGIISVQSLRYSKAPMLAAQSIDRVLVPGGVFKAAWLLQNADEFYKTFRELGYDIAYNEAWEKDHIMLAIKKGNPTKITAAQLLAADGESSIKQKNLLPKE